MGLREGGVRFQLGFSLSLPLSKLVSLGGLKNQVLLYFNQLPKSVI